MVDVLSHKNETLPLLTLRDVTIFPQLSVSLFIGRKNSIKAFNVAWGDETKQVLVVAQKQPEVDNPNVEDLHRVGTLARIIMDSKMQDGTYKLSVEGQQRIFLEEINDVGGYYRASYSPLMTELLENDTKAKWTTQLRQAFEDYNNNNKNKLPKEVVKEMQQDHDLEYVIDYMTHHLPIEFTFKQHILAESALKKRSQLLLKGLGWLKNKIIIDNDINLKVKNNIEKNQKDFYLKEQIKVIQKEINDPGLDELDKLEEQIHQAKLPENALQKSLQELARLKLIPSMSSESAVIRTYLDWIVKLPWSKTKRVSYELGNAKKCLERQHYGLKEVVDRIIEFLAVQKRVKTPKGSIICLVGPPGVGKTSLGESIAKATGRTFVRMSLGGVRDEAEIRGHRKTYIGSLPGKIMQKMLQAECNNPLFLLDEIDKLGADFRGDPSDALLEVLDPEQNKAFNDHYLELDFDLSKVMFVCTANSINIPEALRDRMEIIRIAGYTNTEKEQIALRHLIPKLSKINGLKAKELALDPKVLPCIINDYTREPGVRNLYRELDKLIRKVVTQNMFKQRNAKISKGLQQVKVNENNIEEFLGVVKFKRSNNWQQNCVGKVVGLAWTNSGGELLNLEVSALKGKGDIIRTGSIGDVMQESMLAAITVVRNRAHLLGIDENFYKTTDLHIHVPEGATPKDGPSAGIGICLAIISELSNTALKPNLAMTGEITLKGEVLAIGGLKEKLLVAYQNGIKTVIMPTANEQNLSEIDVEVIHELNIVTVQSVDEVINVALSSPPTVNDSFKQLKEKESLETEKPTH